MENQQENNSPAVERLLQTLDSDPGFAGVTGVVRAVGDLADDDGSNSAMLDAILCDPALTAKLLQLANYTDRTISGRNVSTLEQALSILGPGKIKSIALALTPLESLPDKAQLRSLQTEIVVALFSGLLAAGIARISGSYSEREARVCGLMQNLGRIMALFYIHADIERSGRLQFEQNVTENEAVQQVLGASFEDIGAAIVRYWGLSPILQSSMAPDTLAAPPPVPANAAGWYKLCSLFCRRMAEILFRFPENRERAETEKCLDFFRKALHLNEQEVLATIEQCLHDTDATLAAMDFPCNVARARSLLHRSTDRTMDILLHHDPLVRERGAGEAPIEAIKRIMRLIHGHCGFDCTLICLPLGYGMIAIAGVGRDAGKLTARFRSSGLKRDIFREALGGARDLFIPDVDSPAHATLIPDWYRDVVGAKSLALLPLVHEGKLLGMIYGDYSEPHPQAPPALAEERMQEWRKELTHTILSGGGAFAAGSGAFAAAEESGAGAEAGKPAEPVLRLLHKDKQFRLDAGHPSLKIGRIEKADIVIEDIRASRMHARIEFRHGAFVFVDLSSNGSFILVKGEPEIQLRHNEFTLRDKGSICLGHSHTTDAVDIIIFACED